MQSASTLIVAIFIFGIGGKEIKEPEIYSKLSYDSISDDFLVLLRRWLMLRCRLFVTYDVARSMYYKMKFIKKLVVFLKKRVFYIIFGKFVRGFTM